MIWCSWYVADSCRATTSAEQSLLSTQTLQIFYSCELLLLNSLDCRLAKVEVVVGVESHFVITTFHGEKNTRL